MTKNTLILIFSFFCASIYAQNCLPDGINFSSQQQIDDFATDYSGCSVIEGDVMIFDGAGSITNLNGLLDLTKIEGNLDILLNSNLNSLDGLDNLSQVDGFIKLSYSQDLNSLSGLSNLTTVGNDLSVINTNISSFEGLDKLETVNGNLEIFNNSALTNLSGLESLTSVGGDFNLEQSSALADVEGLKELVSIGGDVEISDIGITNFSGLGKLNTIEGELRISYNDNLLDCTGLNSLSTLNGHLFFLGNPVLNSFDGLGNLTTIGGLLTISGNDALTDLNGLENLSSIGNYLNIAYNDELTSFNGLDGLASIGGNLNIVDNSKLTDISSIETIAPESITSNTGFSADIVIYQNDLLSVCDNSTICTALSNGKTDNINSNATGCNSKVEILDICESSILPVEWAEDLRATKTNDGILLTFATSQEINNELFIIEKSRDGIEFQSLMKIESRGSTSSISRYSSIDLAPYSGLNYYRVKQIDFNTNYAYSNIVAIDNSSISSKLSVYPNPVDTKLNINSSLDEVQIQIYNYHGALIENTTIKKGINSINTLNYKPGIYYIKSSNGVAIKFSVI